MSKNYVQMKEVLRECKDLNLQVYLDKQNHEMQIDVAWDFTFYSFNENYMICESLDELTEVSIDDIFCAIDCIKTYKEIGEKDFIRLCKEINLIYFVIDLTKEIIEYK